MSFTYSFSVVILMASAVIFGSSTAHAFGQRRPTIAGIQPDRPYVVDSTNPKIALLCQADNFLFVARAEFRISGQFVALYVMERRPSTFPRQHLFMYSLPDEVIDLNGYALSRRSDVDHLFAVAHPQMRMKSEEGFPDPRRTYIVRSQEDTNALAAVLDELMADFPLAGAELTAYTKPDETFQTFQISTVPYEGYRLNEKRLATCFAREFDRLPDFVRNGYETYVRKYALIAKLWEITYRGQEQCVQEYFQSIPVPGPYGIPLREPKADRDRRLEKVKKECVERIEKIKSDWVESNRDLKVLQTRK